jgi:hypothetical protein
MFTAEDLNESKGEAPDSNVYQPLAGDVANAPPSSVLYDPINQSNKVCSCQAACECLVVNTKVGAMLGGWLTSVAGGLVGACCIGPALVLADFCCFPPKENHDCSGRVCKVCGVAAAIPGIPAGIAGVSVGGSVGFVSGLLCSPIAFFGCKPKCYNGASAGINEIVREVYDEIRGAAPAPELMR